MKRPPTHHPSQGAAQDPNGRTKARKFHALRQMTLKIVKILDFSLVGSYSSVLSKSHLAQLHRTEKKVGRKIETLATSDLGLAVFQGW